MKKLSLYLICLLLIQVNAKAQVKIGGNNPTLINSGSLLELEATNKGLVFPRVAITDPNRTNPLPAGLLNGTTVFNTTHNLFQGLEKGLYTWIDNKWVSVGGLFDWHTNGNRGSSAQSNFIGTTDSVGLSIRTNNIQRMLVDSAGRVAIGLPSFSSDPATRELLLVDYGNTTSHTIANFKGNVNSYLQINIQNSSASASASTDYVATADDGTDTSNYSDMGINSSAFQPTASSWGTANDGYFYSHSKRLLIGTKRIGSDLIFLSGGGIVNDDAAMTIDGTTRNIVVGKGEGTNKPRGNIIRGPNGNGTNIAGGNLTLRGGRGTGTAPAGSLNLFAGTTAGGLQGDVNISGAIKLIGTSVNVVGVQSTSTVTADSILTIFNGVLKKAAYASVVTITKNSVTLTLPVINNNAGASVDVTIPNTPYVAGGPNPVATVNPEIDFPDGLIIAWVRVSAANTVRIHFRNVSNGSIPSQPIKFDVSILR
jgi:hypothetical protein